MSDEFNDEVCAIEAIYPECVEEVRPLVYRLKVPQNEKISFEIEFSKEYPMEKPTLRKVKSNGAYDDEYLLALFEEVLDSIFQEGMVVVFDLFTELDCVLGEEEDIEAEDHWNQQDTKDIDDLVDSVAATTIEGTTTISDAQQRVKSSSTEEIAPTDDIASTYDTTSTDVEDRDDVDYTNYTYDEEREKANAKVTAKQEESSSSAPLQGWSISEPIVDRKSTFVGFAKEVHSVQEVDEAVARLCDDRKVAKATHVMRAYRVIDGNSAVKYEDCDDDGEAAAGSRMLHLLNIMDAENVLVVAVRWFGGIHLGPDRFRHINSAARDALVKGGFVETNKKKKKKKH